MLHFNNGMPSLGLGLWKIPKEDTARVVVDALKTGYRHLDAACDYGNELETGNGIQQALKANICKREDLWITSKLWNTYHHPEHVEIALQKTLSDLQTPYLDLFLMHFPISLKYVPIEDRYPPEWIHDPEAANPQMIVDPVPLQKTWAAMEALVQKGLVKQIGVCNFSSGLLNDLLAYAEIKPSVLQIESHPYLTQEPLLRRCAAENITVTAFSPLGASSYVELDMASDSERLLTHTQVQNIAQQYNKTPAQILLRWAIQRNTSVICKSSNPQRLEENFDIFNFELSADTMQTLSALNQNRRYNDPKVFCEQAFGCYYPIYD